MAGRTVLNELKKEREQILQTLSNVALTLPVRLQRDLNARLRELIELIGKLRADYQRKQRPGGR